MTGEELRHLRYSIGLRTRISDFARVCGVSTTTIARIESGKAEMSAGLKIKIERAMTKARAAACKECGKFDWKKFRSFECED